MWRNIARLPTWCRSSPARRWATCWPQANLAADVFNAFAEAKRKYIERLKAGQIAKPTEVDQVHKRVMEITGDPLPYGIAPNRKVIQELIGHALTQGIIT